MRPSIAHVSEQLDLQSAANRHTFQGSDTRVRTQKNLVGFLGYTHLKNPPPKNPHFYFNLILGYTLYATNNDLFYCFKAFT